MSFPTFTPQDIADVMNSALAAVDALVSDPSLGITEDKPGAIKLLTMLFLSGLTTAHALAIVKAQAEAATAQQAASSNLSASNNEHQAQQAAIAAQAAALLP